MTMVMDLCKSLPEQYMAEVLIFDHQRGRELVAAIEIVSRENKDRPETRQAFVSKCAALLQKKICVSIVDLVNSSRLAFEREGFIPRSCSFRNSWGQLFYIVEQLSSAAQHSVGYQTGSNIIQHAPGWTCPGVLKIRYCGFWSLRNFCS